jgi:hypothetical protein
LSPGVAFEKVDEQRPAGGRSLLSASEPVGDLDLMANDGPRTRKAGPDNSPSVGYSVADTVSYLEVFT